MDPANRRMVGICPLTLTVTWASLSDQWYHRVLSKFSEMERSSEMTHR